MEHSISIVFDKITVARGRRVMLSSVSGLVHGGHLTAAISCCGNRGDTYLLSALAGNEEFSGGDILASGAPITSQKYQRAAALIDEDLTLHEELTVLQNLMYSAEMRVADSVVAIKQRVEDVMAQLALMDCAEKEIRLCSPCVRRRVTVGKELVLNPSALFVDNPVEGLPVHEARLFLTLLKKTAVQTGRIVMISMVQPRWTLIDIVDSVILFERANTVFHGTKDELLAALLSSASSTPEMAVIALYRAATNPSGSVDALFAHTNNSQKVASDVINYMQSCASGVVSLTIPKPTTPPWGIVQFINLLKCNILEINNHLMQYLEYFIVIVVFAVLLAAVYSQQDGQAGMQNRIGIIFFLISSTFLHSMLLVDQRRKEYVSCQRHRYLGYFGPITILCHWVLTGALVRFAGTIVITIVVYSIANIDSRWNFTVFSDLVAIVAATSFSTATVVWLICSIFTSTKMTHFMLFLIYAWNTILAGIILNVNTLSQTFQVLSFGSLIRLGYESALVSQFHGESFGCVAPANETASCYTGDMYIKFLGFSVERQWTNLEIMATCCGVCTFLFFTVLCCSRPPRKTREETKSISGWS